MAHRWYTGTLAGEQGAARRVIYRDVLNSRTPGDLYTPMAHLWHTDRSKQGKADNKQKQSVY